jgi:hypothetical protein
MFIKSLKVLCGVSSSDLLISYILYVPVAWSSTEYVTQTPKHNANSTQLKCISEDRLLRNLKPLQLQVTDILERLLETELLPHQSFASE